MSNYIKVDHSEFEKCAKEIDDYVALMKKNMTEAQNHVQTLSSAWQGTDSSLFKTKFEEADGNDSVHYQLLKALESYAKYLRYASSKYKDAQAKAIDRARALPKW